MICCLFYTLNYGKTERTTIYHMVKADLSVERSKFMVWLITFLAVLITAMTPILNLVTAISIVVYTFKGIQKKRKIS